MSVVEKDDIWDTKNSFRNLVNQIIIQKNFLCDTMEELEAEVLQGVKDWIDKEKPRPSVVDGPWQLYVRRHIIRIVPDYMNRAISMQVRSITMNPSLMDGITHPNLTQTTMLNNEVINEIDSSVGSDELSNKKKEVKQTNEGKYSQ